MENFSTILDTNVLRYSLLPVFKPQIEKYMTQLIDHNAKLTISQVSIFELLQAANDDKEKEGQALLNKFQSFSLDRKVLIVAARLAGLYQRYGGINLKGFDSGDLYIAATAVLTNSRIVTSNIKDYPHPIFLEIESCVIQNKDKFDRTEYIGLYLLNPNYAFLKDKLFTEIKRL